MVVSGAAGGRARRCGRLFVSRGSAPVARHPRAQPRLAAAPPGTQRRTHRRESRVDDLHLEHEPALVRRAAALLGRRPHLVHRQSRPLSPGSGAAVRESRAHGVPLRRVGHRGNRDRPAAANRAALDRADHHRRFHSDRAAPGVVAGDLRGGAAARGGHLTAAAPAHAPPAEPSPAVVAGAACAAPRLRVAPRGSVAGIRRRIPVVGDWPAGRLGRGGTSVLGVLHHRLHGELFGRRHRGLRARGAARTRSRAHQRLAALGVVSLFIVVLALPMLSGRWLASPDGDQYYSGYAVKVWAKDTYAQTGQFPLWNPMIMLGLPHIDVVTHGDVLYPTSALRLVMPVYQAMNLAFVIHYILAGFLMYLFLRRLGASWIGSVTGGLAYQLSGIVISYVHPGHDGKLFVSTMLPLAFLALLAALRDKRSWGYPLLALAVALCLLSPHVQTTYYLLIAASLFALYLTFGEPSADPMTRRVGRLALTLAAVIVGFGIAMPQILPFIQYIPHSPRAGGYAVGYQGSTSYGIPWNHIPEFIIAGFTGTSFETYWGSNPLKLHSEYLGLPVIALAILGLGDRRRRLVWWTAGIGALFLLIALGASTPFYHLWWAVMPYVKKTRAPGMVFFIVAFCTAIFAAFGVDRLERKEIVAAQHARVWLIAAGVVALFGVIGVFGQLAQSLAPTERLALAIARGSFIRVSALIGAVLFASVALLAWGWLKGRVPVLVFALGLPVLVGADLWRNGEHFWMYAAKPSEGAYRTDALVTRLQAEPKPLRVLNFDVYPHNVLIAFGIPQVLGYQGSELRYFDDLIGGRPGAAEPRFLYTSIQLWHLLAVRYVIIPDTANLPGYHRVLGPVTTGSGA